MRFERTRDLALVRSALTHPKIWPFITDDFSPPPDQFTPFEHESIWYVAVYDADDFLGIFMFVPQSPVCWEVHTCLLPVSWGARAAEAARGVQKWIFGCTPCRRIVTNVPAYNRLALRFAKAAGMTEYGRNTSSYLKNGQLHDQFLLGVSKET